MSSFVNKRYRQRRPRYSKLRLVASSVSLLAEVAELSFSGVIMDSGRT